MTKTAKHQNWILRWRPMSALGVTVCIVLLQLVVAATMQGQTYSVVYSFGSVVNDGSDPIAGLVLDAHDNLYGTTYEGGAAGYGTVFKIDTTGTETVLHNFAGIGAGDGAHPHAGLALDAQDNLYGTTWMGGAHGQTGQGTVFKVDATGNETVLFEFDGAGGDGTKPSGLVLDAQGNLYGTTALGGANGANKDGTVFKLDAAGNETILHTFRTGPTDGATPYGGVVLDAEGNLYGTTTRGGRSIYPGSVFKLGTTGVETVLHRFAGSPDGATPYAGLVLDGQGNMYGTTYGGGTAGHGAVFKVDSSGNETVLYSFTGTPDGANPYGGLVLDAEGNLYGTTYGGGAAGYGTLFEINATSNETVLHSFGSTKGDGKYPYAGLVLDALGDLYGTTTHGGAHNKGTVFKLTLQ
jgi:uncharacterized repeat protein (TIGR03803 family)